LNSLKIDRRINHLPAFHHISTFLHRCLPTTVIYYRAIILNCKEYIHEQKVLSIEQMKAITAYSSLVSCLYVKLYISNCLDHQDQTSFSLAKCAPFRCLWHQWH